MNILVVCHYGLYEDLTFSFVHNQIREYAKLGHRVRVIIPNGLGKTGRDGKRIGKSLHLSTVDNVELYDLRYLTLSHYGKKRFNARSAMGAIRMHWKKIFRNFHPQVIHAHTLGFDSEIGAWLKGIFKVPLVVTTHGETGCEEPFVGHPDQIPSYTDKADYVICVSSKLEEKIQSCGATAPLKTIINGFIPRDVPGDAVRQPLRMIQVCHLIPLKRVDVTIRAFAKLHEQQPDMELVIIGQGYLRPQLEALCQELGVSQKVRFLGQLPNEQVFQELCQSSFFVMASKPEGFGIAYLEAMAAGCVTVGTEGEGISDVITNDKNGYLVPADCPEAIVHVIEACLADPQKASILAAQGQQDARALTWQKNASQYLNLFQTLL